MMEKCNGHQVYATREEAAQEMARLIRRAKRTGEGGKSWKRLNVYPCGAHFHIGRANKLPKAYKRASNEKPMTVGQARRALARLDRAMDRHTDWYHRRMAEILGRVIAADRAGGDIDLTTSYFEEMAGFRRNSDTCSGVKVSTGPSATLCPRI